MITRLSQVCGLALPYNQIDRTPTGKEIYGMQMRIGTTLLMSAYLSAMLATSVASSRQGAEFAGTIDLAAVTGAVSPASAMTPPPELDPKTARERMARLLAYVNALEYDGSTIGLRLCVPLNLCDGKQPFHIRLGKGDAKPGNHYLGVRADAKTKDVIIMVITGGVVEVYLTDATGVLRAAAVQDEKGARIVTNESAAAKYKAELDAFLEEAAVLPPTGQAVAGNG